jgi:hypothetical protein
MSISKHPNKAVHFVLLTLICLEKLPPGEHYFTLVLFQRYDPKKMCPAPKATVVAKYFTVVDSNTEEKR